MINIDIHSSETIHEQLVSKFTHLIISGALGEGEKLPSIRQLANELVINPHTINKAYTTLEEKKLVTCKKNKGYFVNSLSETSKDEEINKIYEDINKNIQILLNLGVSKESATEKIKTIIKSLEV